MRDYCEGSGISERSLGSQEWVCSAPDPETGIRSALTELWEVSVSPYMHEDREVWRCKRTCPKSQDRKFLILPDSLKKYARFKPRPPDSKAHALNTSATWLPVALSMKVKWVLVLQMEAEAQRSDLFKAIWPFSSKSWPCRLAFFIANPVLFPLQGIAFL